VVRPHKPSDPVPYWKELLVTPHTPAYRHHKARNLAVVTIDGKDHYLGSYDSPESREKYDRLIALWLGNGRKMPVPSASDEGTAGPTVNEVILDYYRHALTYYRKPSGAPTSAANNIRLALARLRRPYGTTPAAEFDSVALEAVRGQMIGDGLCRGRINKDVSRLKRMFK
jgi:hypothetical protein